MGYIEGNIRIPGVRVHLYRENANGSFGTFIATEVTPSSGGTVYHGVTGSGRYFFSGLDAGAYVACFEGRGLDGFNRVRDRARFIVDQHQTGSAYLRLQVYDTWELAKDDWNNISTGQPLFVISGSAGQPTGMVTKIASTGAGSYGYVSATGGTFQYGPA